MDAHHFGVRRLADYDHGNSGLGSLSGHFVDAGNERACGVQQFTVQRLQPFDFRTAHAVGTKYNLGALGHGVRPIDAYHALLTEHFHHLRIVDDRAQRDRRRGSRRRIYRPAHTEAEACVLCNDNFSDRNQLPTFLNFSFANKSKFR